MASVREVLERADDVTIIAEKNGTKITTIDDATAIANAEFVERQAEGKKASAVSAGIRTYNPDGSLARIRSKVSAINPSTYFANRFRKTQKRLWVVIDWRAIIEQNTGRIYIKNIPVWVLVRDESGDLKVDYITTVSDTDFVSDYTNTLSDDAMKQIMPLIANYGSNVSVSEMPI